MESGYVKKIKLFIIIFVLLGFSFVLSCSVREEGIGDEPKPNERNENTNLLENEKSILYTRLDTYLKEVGGPEKFSGSVLIAQKGVKILSKGYSMANYELGVPNSPETAFRIGSITKPITAIAIMQLQERGLLNVNDPLSKYFPDYRNGDKIFIHHLLTHTSGIPDFIKDDKDNFLLSCKDCRKVDEIIKSFKDKPLKFEPGTKFEYCNSGYVLLGAIIEKITVMSYRGYIDRNIFKPLNMSHSGQDRQGLLLKNRASGYVLKDGQLANVHFTDISNYFAEGDLYSTVEDLYLLDRALYNETILSQSSIMKMFCPFRDCYGYGWMIGEIAGRECFYHYGHREGFYSAILRFVNEDVVVIVLTNLDHTPIDTICHELSRLVFST